MTRFEECLKVILRAEGGYVNDPVDRGGATNKGFTQRVYDQWRKNCGIPSRSVEFITDDEVSSIYKTEYWFAAKCQLLPEPLDLYTFDAAVNHGVSRAVKQLQHVLGVAEDGQFGPKSIDALHEEMKAGQVQELADHLIANRLDFYHSIVDRNPSQVKFIAGWENRIDHLRLAA